MRKSLLIFLLGFPVFFYGQSDLQRYRNKIFDDVEVHKNISYKTNEMPPGKVRDYLADVYLPKHDQEKNRPLIIWLHGGGFKLGKKKSRGIPLWCRDFAKRGYVAVAINYRKKPGLPNNNFRTLASGCYDVIQDLDRVIRFFKLHYQEYGIDTNRIVLAGNSSGSMANLQFVYSDEHELAVMGSRSDSALAFKPYNAYHISALVNFWGGIFDSTWMERARVPIVSVHGEKDGVAPFNFKGPLNGAAVIHRQADRLGIPNKLRSYPELKHELQKPFHPFLFGAKAKRRWHEAGDFAAAFLWEKVGIGN